MHLSLKAVVRVRSLSPLGVAFLAVLAFSCGKSARPDGMRAAVGGTGGASSGSGGGARAGSGGAGGGAGAGGTAGATGGGEGGEAGEAPVPVTSSVSLDGSPFYTRAQRLTNAQWEHSVTDILRFDAPANLSQSFLTPAAGVTDFTNNERVLFVDRQFVVDYEAAAEAAAALATGSPEALAAVYDGTNPAEFVQALGRRAFRRPLTATEVAKYEGAFALGEMFYGAGFEHGAAVVIRAMLQSPHFLYRIEFGAAGEPLSGYEVAAKLSLWLLGTTPSDELLDAAEGGELDTVEEVEAVARGMLEDPRALPVMRDFHSQLHELGRIAGIEKAGVPEFTIALNDELAEASTMFFDRVFSAGGGLREILTSTEGFVGTGLASIYGLAVPASGLELRDLGPERQGWFMQAPFLIVESVNDQPDPIRRGLALHTNVLCAALPPPAADPPPLPPPTTDGLTNRERITALTASCGGECHARFIDPLGFAFEAFDGMGRERATDNGKPIDATGSYPFAEGTEAFDSAGELMQVLADSPQAHTCYAKMVTGYGLQRDVVEVDRPLLEALAATSIELSLKETIVRLVRDPAFLVRAEGTP